MRLHLFVAAVLAALPTGCTAGPQVAPAGEPEPVRARAALATIVVSNGTDRRVTVSYRVAGREAPEVAVGRVPPATSTELAPVPAGELIILTARTDAGGELVLPARTFAIDDEWTWEIPAGTPFGPPVRPREDER
ncbi:MAG TPA: hypothetical protein VK936_12045 [Longimicrobiales bacterium]|nr:hypothetical protein [Longimicrobiales bacterium]